jgi:HSP20 family protein
MFSALTNVDRALDEFRWMEQQMDELFGSGTQAPAIRSLPRGAFPPINVGASPEQIEVYLFAAGLDPKTIELSIQQNVLTVSGARHLQTRDDADYYRQERYRGEFRRVVALPDDVDPERIEAKYRDGVLQVTARRRESAKPRQITVQ